MKIKKILPIVLSITMLTTTLLTGCGEDVVTKVNENGDLSSSVELEQVDDENQNLPTYDINTLEQSTNEISLSEVPSYYKQLLNERNKIIYDDIKAAYNDYKPEVILKKTCTEEELFKIISILYVDEPMLFQMKPQYDYYLDSNGYVYKLNIYYNLSQIEYNQYLNRLENKLLATYSTVYNKILEDNEAEDENVLSEEKGITDYDAFCVINQETIDNAIDISKPTDDKLCNTVLGTLTGKNTPFSIAKYNALIYRNLGINTSVVIGKLTNDEYSNALQNNASGKGITCFADVKSKYTTTTEENGNIKYTVNFNFDDYYAWNIIEINGKWYHYDKSLPSYNSMVISQNEGESGDVMTENCKFNNLLSFVNDYTISASRIFYYSDQILGEIPLCTSKAFQYSYREGYYVLSYTENQMKTYLENKIEIWATKQEDMYFQFEDEKTYQYFLDNLQGIINAYNQDSLTKIIGYNLTENKDMLFVYLSDLKMKK